MFNSVSRTIRLAALGAVAAASLAAQPAFAGSASSNLGVTATVTSNCSVSTSPVAFGNVDVTSGSAVDGTGGLLVTCTNGTGWSAGADVGGGAGADLLTRKMTSGGSTLDYALFVDSSRTSVWGDGEDTATIDDIGTGAEQAKTIYGQVRGNQAGAPAGSYADTVTVTVTY